MTEKEFQELARPAIQAFVDSIPRVRFGPQAITVVRGIATEEDDQQVHWGVYEHRVVKIQRNRFGQLYGRVVGQACTKVG